MIPEFGSRLGLICVVILIQSCSAHPDLPKMEQLQSVLDEGSTKPTWEMVQEAVGEFTNWDRKLYQGYREMDEKTLLRDTVIYPFRQYAGLTDVNERDTFLDKLFAAYKLFWPNYVAKREIPGGSVGMLFCESFRTGVLYGEKDKPLTINDFHNAVEEIEWYSSRINTIVENGDLPSRHQEVAAIYNALIQNKVIWKTWQILLEFPLEQRNLITIGEIKEIFKRGIELGRKIDEEQDKDQGDLRWKMEVENRQRQSEEMAHRLDQIEREGGPKQVKRRNNPSPSEEAGPSGHS